MTPLFSHHMALKNFDTIRFRDTDSIKTTLKNNDDVIVARSREFGKIL